MSTRQKKKSPKRGSKAIVSFPAKLRRWSLWLLSSTAIASQMSSCGFMPAPELLPGRPHAPQAPASPSLPPVDLAYTGFKECPQFFAGGVSPRVRPEGRLRELCYSAFAVLHNGNTRTPMFVAERLNRASVQQARGESRTDKFFADARLPRAERAELTDYRNSGYARGHMAPAGDMPSADAMAQSFSLANMIPQHPSNNSGPWAKIEKDTRNYVLRAQGDVYVITGPVFEEPASFIGGGRVRVPSYIFKLVYDAKTQRAWAHWQQNTAGSKAGAPISYGELEKRIGMELLPGVTIR